MDKWTNDINFCIVSFISSCACLKSSGDPPIIKIRIVDIKITFFSKFRVTNFIEKSDANAQEAASVGIDSVSMRLIYNTDREFQDACMNNWKSL